MKRLSADAYQAFRDALAAVTWNKRAFETFLRTALRDETELLVGLDFNLTKRETADAVVDRLLRREAQYQQVTLRLMLELADMTEFPNLRRIKDPADRELRLKEARVSVARLKTLTRAYAGQLESQESVQAAIHDHKARTELLRKFDGDLGGLKQEFLDLQAATDARKRGYALESLLVATFALFDLEPRLAYKIDLEQIDGSFSLETDDYIVEARWHKDPQGRDAGDIFAEKVRSKGKNALGLFVAINGFTSTFYKRFESSTPFITMDGGDFYSVLDGRVRLDDLLRAKKRHANETGSCHLPANAILNS